MTPLQAAFFLNKTAYAEADLVPQADHESGEAAQVAPSPAYTPPPLPGGHLHPLYQRLALAKDHLDSEWRNWVAERGENNPYGFMGYIAQHSPEARARAARRALVAPPMPSPKMAAASEHALRREGVNGKFRKHVAGDERPSTEEIAMSAKAAAEEFYGTKIALGLKDMLRMQHYASAPVAHVPHVPPAVASIPAVAKQWLAKQEFSAPKAIKPMAAKMASSYLSDILKF